MKDAGAVGFQKAVKEIYDLYSSTSLEGDVDRWMGLWDENGVQMPPDVPMRCGKDVIDALVRKDLQRVRYDTFVIDNDEATVDRDFGFARGNYHYSFVRNDTGVRYEREGKYLTIFRRQADGSWKIYRDCFNLNAPAR